MGVPVVVQTVCAAVFALILIGGMARADQLIALPDGQFVILKDDGTWEYFEEKISGVLSLSFGTPKDQDGQCHAWPSLTNNTNKFVDGLAINYSTHYGDGATIRTSTLNFNIVDIGKVVTQQEYLTNFASATCNEVQYIQIDGIKTCKIGGKKKSAKVCFELLEVVAEGIQAVK